MILILSVVCVHRECLTLSIHGLGPVGVRVVPKPASVGLWPAEPQIRGQYQGHRRWSRLCSVWQSVVRCFGACGHSWLVIHGFPENVLLSFRDLP